MTMPAGCMSHGRLEPVCPLQVPQNATRTITQVVTQPLLNSTGQLRWALNNIANTVSHA